MLDTWFGTDSNKFTNTMSPFTPSEKVQLNLQVFHPFVDGLIEYQQAISETLKALSRKGIQASAWVSEIVKDMLHALKGSSMVQVKTTASYPMDGAGSSAGYCIR